MKRIIDYLGYYRGMLGHLFVIGTAVIMVSCAKTGTMEDKDTLSNDRIAFSINSDVLDFNTSTKATVVNTATLKSNGFYVTATSGSGISIWSNVLFEKEGRYFVSDKKWPNPDPSMKFYACNTSFTYTDASTCTVDATNATDVVCAVLTSSNYQHPNSLMFEHIFTRIGKVTVTGEDGYTIDNVYVRITPKTGGTYNMISKTWTSTTNGSLTTLLSGSPKTVTADRYLVPGSYNIGFVWRARKSSYTKTFTKSITGVELSAGMINNISAHLSGNAEELQFNVSVEPWGSYSNDIGDYLYTPKPTFNGKEWAPGPMYYDGTTFQIDDDWLATSWEDKYGLVAGSYYFNHQQVAEFFDSHGSAYTAYTIDNAGSRVSYDGNSDWRLPDNDDATDLWVSGRRSGATVNGTTGALYATIQMTGITINGQSNPYVYIFFPDGYTIMGKALNVNSSSVMTGFTLADVNEYISQGCLVFAPNGTYTNVSSTPTWGFPNAVRNWTTRDSKTQYTDSSFYTFLLSVNSYGYSSMMTQDWVTFSENGTKQFTFARLVRDNLDN